MVDNTTNSILERIANALERLAPPDKKINNCNIYNFKILSMVFLSFFIYKLLSLFKV